MDQTILDRIGKPMSNEDLEKYLAVRKHDIMKYSKLSDFKTIEELLPKDNDFQIILIEDKYNSGHWISVERKGKTINYFNSYGAKEDTDWRFIPRMIRIILGQNTNDLTRLFKEAESRGYKVVRNKKRLQKLDDKIQTCGRWVVFWRHLSQMGYSMKQFQDQIEKLRDNEEKKAGVRPTGDYIVSKYID
jgi:hypothetical protein